MTVENHQADNSSPHGRQGHSIGCTAYDYNAAFHSTEILFGLLSQEIANQTDAGGGWRRDSRWFGRSTWQDRYSRVDPSAL